MSNQNEKQSSLHRYTRETITLEDALSDCTAILVSGGKDAVAMLYATNRCVLARLQDGILVDQDNAAVDTSSVYEARVFSDNADFRWLNREAGSGDGALLSESQLQLDSAWKDQGNVDLGNTSAGTIKQSDLLWGESVGLPNRGWVKMATPRIGGYYVPLAETVESPKSETNVAKLRLQLNAIEYLCQEARHGNVFVAEERWLNISVAKTETRGEAEG